MADLRKVDPRWRIWDLDAEMRYQPAVDALPPGPCRICEIGSGAAGIARWTSHQVVGVDPGPDDRHGGLLAPPNLERIMGSGEAIPLADESVPACVAIDTLEHIPRDTRPAVIADMVRVTATGGRVILLGPAGTPAAAADRRLLDLLHRRGVYGGWTTWLEEHLQYGLPSLAELGDSLSALPRVQRVTVQGQLNLRIWWLMHRAALGIPRRAGPLRYLPHPTPVHPQLWTPLAILARRYRRGPFYRYMFIASVR
jgi:SAM-dependent methyltransferase